MDRNMAIYYSNRAGCLFEAGHHQAATEDYNRAINIQPTNPSLYLRRADVLEAMGRREEAESNRGIAADLTNNY